MAERYFQPAGGIRMARGQRGYFARNHVQVRAHLLYRLLDALGGNRKIVWLECRVLRAGLMGVSGNRSRLLPDLREEQETGSLAAVNLHSVRRIRYHWRAFDGKQFVCHGCLPAPGMVEPGQPVHGHDRAAILGLQPVHPGLAVHHAGRHAEKRPERGTYLVLQHALLHVPVRRPTRACRFPRAVADV